jgi:hypothetical protein
VLSPDGGVPLTSGVLVFPLGDPLEEPLFAGGAVPVVEEPLSEEPAGPVGLDPVGLVPDTSEAASTVVTGCWRVVGPSTVLPLAAVTVGGGAGVTVCVG